MKTIRHSFQAHDKLLHIEADGCIVNIQVGLWDDKDHRVTRIAVLPDQTPDDGNGTWKLASPVAVVRVIRYPEEETPATQTDLRRIVEYAAASSHYRESIFCRERPTFGTKDDKLHHCLRCDAETLLAEGL